VNNSSELLAIDRVTACYRGSNAKRLVGSGTMEPGWQGLRSIADRYVRRACPSAQWDEAPGAFVPAVMRRRRAFSSRRSGLLTALLCAAVGIAFLLAAPPAVAQDTTLVTNFHVEADTSGSSARYFAQRFTTGAHTGGYTVTSVQLRLFEGTVTDSTAVPDITIKADNNGEPASGRIALLALQEGTTLAEGTNTFTAPADTTLEPNTNYFIFSKGASNASNRPAYESTARGADTYGETGASGWSIENETKFRNYGGQEWGSDVLGILFIQINGSTNTADTADITAPTLSSAAVDGTALVLTYDEALDTGSVPAASDFTVKVNTAAVTLATGTPVTVAGRAVTLTLANAVTHGQTVTVSYAPGTNPIQDAASNDALALSDEPVTNNAPVPCNAPTLTDRTVIATVTVNIGNHSNNLLFGATSSYGSLSGDTSFTIGSRSYTIDGVWVHSSRSTLTFSLTSLLAGVDAARLQLHACEDTFDFRSANVWTGVLYGHSTWSGVDLDWRNVTTRTLRLSVPTAAVPSSALVSNFEQAFADSALRGHPGAIDFVTGSHPEGYELSGISVMNADAANPQFSAWVCPDEIHQFPPVRSHIDDDPCVALTPPSSFAAGMIDFTAPRDTILAPNTSYKAVFSRRSFGLTASTSEDGSSESGWTIRDFYWTYVNSDWVVHSASQSFFLAVRATQVVSAGSKATVAAPRKLKVESGRKRARLRWDLPPDIAQSEIDHWEYRSTTTMFSDGPVPPMRGGVKYAWAWTRVNLEDDDPLTALLTGLENTSTHFQVRAVTGAGPGARATVWGHVVGGGFCDQVEGYFNNSDRRKLWWARFPHDVDDQTGTVAGFIKNDPELSNLGTTPSWTMAGDGFTLGGVRYTVTGVYTTASNDGTHLQLRIKPQVPTGSQAALKAALRLSYCSWSLDGSDAQMVSARGVTTFTWNSGAVQDFTLVNGSPGRGTIGAILSVPRNFTAPQVEADPGCSGSNDIWCATMTVGSDGLGYHSSDGSLSDSTFTYNGENYEVERLEIESSVLTFEHSTDSGAFDVAGFALQVGGVTYPTPADTVSSGGNHVWDPAVDPGWEGGEQVTVRLYTVSTAKQVAVDPPSVDGTPRVSGAGSDAQWRDGETVGVTLTFTEAVDVDTTDGTPSIGIDLSGAGTARRAAYASGTGTTELVFEYTLVTGDGTHGSMAVTPDSLALNGGSIQSTEHGVDALLAHNGTVVLGTSARNIEIPTRFQNVPERHDGQSPITVDVRFSGAPTGLSATRDGPSIFEASAGTVTGATVKTKGAQPVWTVTVNPDGVGEVTVRLPARACSEAYAVCIGGEPLANALEATVAGPPMTAELSRVPATHDGRTRFKIHLEFSHAPRGLGYRTVRDHLFDVSGGQILKARRLVRGKSQRWELTIQPTERGALTLTARATTDCSAQHKVCDREGRRFDGELSLMVRGPETRAPAIDSATTIEVAEGETAVATLTATDADTEIADLSWSIPTGSTGGDDAAHFALASNGTLTFVQAKDFDAPDDADTDGDYEVTVEVNDGVGPVKASLVVRLVEADDTAPALESAAVDAAALTLTYDETLDADSVPAASAFSVTVGEAARAVESVEVADTAVTLTLGSAAASGETVTVDYTVPTGEGAAPLADEAGNQVAAFTGQTVTNETGSGVPTISIAAASTPVTEGAAVAFTLARTGATDDALTVTVSVTQAGSVLDGTPATTVTFAEEAATATLSVATEDDTVDEADAQVQAAIASAEGYQVDTEGSSARVDVFDNDEAEASDGVEALWSTTLTWTDVGGGWAGGYADAFAQSSWTEDEATFRIWYIALNTSTGALFMAHDGSGGAIPDADQLTLHIGDVEVSATTVMQLFAEASVAIMHDVGSQWTLGDTVPVRLTRTTQDAGETATKPTASVADAQVREAAGTPLRFQVTLDTAPTSTVSIRYRSSDGTATAGQDYTAVHGAVRFAPGQTTRTVSVDVIEDAHDEGSETMTLTLSEPYGATVLDGSATGTINNSDVIPGAWITRFGRTVASQAIDALTGRFDSGGGSHVTIAGVSLTGDAMPEDEEEATPGRTLGLPAFDEEEITEENLQTMTARELIAGSSFQLSSTREHPGQAAFTAWGRFATSSFDGVEDGVAVQGDVHSGLVGADAEWGRWLAGMMLSQSEGDGSYGASLGQDDDGGTIESSMTAAYPYARWQLNHRVSTWGMVGVGAGDLTVTRSSGETFRTDLGMRMGALGMKGQLLDGSGPSRMLVNVKSDAMWVRTESDRTTGMEAAEGDATRLRLTLQAERPFTTESGGSFVPSAEVGVRLDGGDAETGAGLEVGTGMRYVHGRISIEGQVRTLVAHEDSGYEEWGASGAIRVNPSPSGRGLTLGVTPVWGNAWSQTERLWGAHTARELAPEAEFDAAAGLEAELGYGFDAPGNRGTITPYTGLSLSDGSGRTVRAGTQWDITPRTTLGLEANRQESTDGAPAAQTVRFRTQWTLAPGAVVGFEASRHSATVDSPSTRGIGVQAELRW